MSDQEHLAQAALAYDSLAGRYDELSRENGVLAHSARVSSGLVRSCMSTCDLVLEIGCGTGRETLELAAGGKRVVACDPSGESLAILQQKASSLGLMDLIEARKLPASGISELSKEFGPHAFAGAFASFALSYEPDLGSIPGQVWELLKPNSPFLCSIFNRVCLTEILLLAPFLLPRRGLRRLEGRTMLPVGEFRVMIKSYTAGAVKRTFSPHFSWIGAWAIPAIIPPHYLHRLMGLSGVLRPAWEAADLKVNSRWPLKYLGSHTALLFESVRREALEDRSTEPLDPSIGPGCELEPGDST